MNDLKGKVPLVTGASKSIGVGISLGLAAAGARVAVNYAGDAAGAKKTVDAIVTARGKATPVRGDVTRAADFARIFEDVFAASGD